MSPELSPAPAAAPELEPDAGGPMTNSGGCYFCGQRVYVLERISAEGKFFHRSCFTCHQCAITLRLGGYTFDQATGEDAFVQKWTLDVKVLTSIVPLKNKVLVQ